MMRVIVTPAVLPPSALAELKEWLGISTTLDDAPLTQLLEAAIDVCTDYTGLTPLTCTVEETIRLPTDWRRIPPASEWQTHAYPAEWSPPATQPGWQVLATRPVISITSVHAVRADGTRDQLDTNAYDLRINAEGECGLRVIDPGNHVHAVVRFTAGLASQWSDLPPGIRHGIIRLAAHQHRAREDAGASPLPAASVTAMWRPWRRVRLT
ncbi:hypothetical protein GTZ99_14130 [Novosphingobium sp. FSY-8]|uniref:PhiE125 gp8 family phage protein n=1 Tax=Novosphingobium ovatum TaxID=1908523 RepID=A0ABW9XGL1_9SPHN|nr:phage head-tail connector protein [Novosphingobium ovatum]NBC37689.1 hypothetical protein [Novosphingobium ovatum]